MKTYIIFIFWTLASCSFNSDRDLLMIDYEQTFPDGTKKDLSIRIMSSVDVGYITGQDSLDYLFGVYNEKYYTKNADSLIVLLEEWVINYDLKITDFQNKIDSVKSINNDSKLTINWKEIYTTAINDHEVLQQGHQEKLDYLLKYNNRKDENLIKKVKYLFKVKNPDEQELAKIYLFAPDESKVVNSLWETEELL